MKISHPQIRIFLRGKSGFFATAAGQSPGLPAALAAAIREAAARAPAAASLMAELLQIFSKNEKKACIPEKAVI